MRFSSNTLLLLTVIVAAFLQESTLAASKRPSRSAASRSSSRPSSRRPPGRSSRPRYEEDEDEEDDFGYPPDESDEEDAVEDYDDEEDDYSPPSRRSSPPSSRGRGGGSRKPPSSSRSSKSGGSSRRPRYEDDDYRRPPSRGRGPPGRGGRRDVVPYSRQQPSTFTRGLDALRNSIPDPSTVREAAVASVNAARATTTNLSANLYREVKGLTSSELEQVMLKATRPDDTAVKGKHVERLVGVTYQISSRYDIYDAVLRKLWSKMAENDWRTTIKALYILHRFSADGAPEHAPALKARLRELRRTVDPKRKEKYFNTKQLLSGENKPESKAFRGFMSRYAHYVLLRAQCFGGSFDEIKNLPAPPKNKKKKQAGPPKPITSTCLRNEHLEAASMILKAGVACQLKDGEDCENTAIAAERVVSDLIALTGATAIALNRALKDDAKGVDTGLIKKWCEFYSKDLLPKTRSTVKKTAAKLDAYGLFLPSRMGATVSQDLLQKGLKMEESESASTEDDEEETAADEKEAKADAGEEPEPEAEGDDEEADAAEDAEDAAAEEEGEEYDEYEYEEEDYYDDEEPF